MYQFIKSIYFHRNNKAITTDDFETDIAEKTEWLEQIEKDTAQKIPQKELLVAFICFGQFRYQNQTAPIISYLEKVLELPANQTTIYWLCKYELQRSLLTYYQIQRFETNNEDLYGVEKKIDELLEKISAEKPQYEQMKMIYGIKEYE